jgi:hypothetical protein
MKVEYSSNNSGGSWWLKDKHWKDLEKAGWHVLWGNVFFCHPTYEMSWQPKRSEYPCESSEGCEGHRNFETWQDADKTRYMGALAKEAYKDFDSLKDAITEWERVTELDASDEGCGCCGPPHSFVTRGDEYAYVSGEECASVLYDNAPRSYREALEEIKELKERTKGVTGG